MRSTNLPLIFTLLSSVPLSCLGSVAIEPAKTDKHHPNSCWVVGSGRFVGVGESWRSSGGGCGVSTCLRVQDRMMISHESCGVVDLDPPCYLFDSPGESYPDCCPQLMCPEEGETEEEFLEKRRNLTVTSSQYIQGLEQNFQQNNLNGEEEERRSLDEVPSSSDSLEFNNLIDIDEERRKEGQVDDFTINEKKKNYLRRRRMSPKFAGWEMA